MVSATTATEATPKGALHTALWVAQFLLACAFGMAGVGKSTAPIAELAADLPWVRDVPVLLVRFIGAAEFAGGLGMVLPAVTGIRPVLTSFAGVGLALVMVLAAGFHVTRGELPVVIVNAILGALALFVAWGRFKRAPIPPR